MRDGRARRPCGLVGAADRGDRLGARPRQFDGSVGDRGGAAVAITFPSKTMFVEYIRPAPYSDPESGLRGLAADFGSSDFVHLNGTTPAVYLPANDGSGLNAVLFQTNGAEVRVVGQNDEATLEAIAQSILSQQLPSASS